MKGEIMWAIYGNYGLYTGTALIKTDMIKKHCKELGMSWYECRKKGDRAIKVKITPLTTNPKED